MRDVVAAELWLREPLDPARLNGCGLVVVNPPYPVRDRQPRRSSTRCCDRLGASEAGRGKRA